MTTKLIPEQTLNCWRARARRGAIEEVYTLTEFRELIPEFKAEGVLMQAYADAAEAMMIAPETLRDKLGKIRNYPLAKMVDWIKHGVSFDHFEKANTLAEIAHKSPAQLLDEAVEMGDEHGSPLTVRELVAHAMSEVPTDTKAVVYRRTVLLEQLKKFPTDGWDDERKRHFEMWRESGKRFLE